jgi:hypothetical protein
MAQKKKKVSIASIVRPAATAPLALVETPSVPSLRLDLGCGQNPKEGFEGVDLYGDKAKHKVDLFKFPWPFADESVDEIHCSHFMEHVPAREIEERDLVRNTGSDDAYRNKFVGQDMLFAFVDECYRILKPDAWMHVIVPSGRSNRAFQDPTHRRFFMQETFLYFNAEWRRINSLDHYRAKCNFGFDTGFSLPQEESLRAAEVQQARFQNMWNVTIDWIAKMKKLPPLPVF